MLHIGDGSNQESRIYKYLSQCGAVPLPRFSDDQEYRDVYVLNKDSYVTYTEIWMSSASSLPDACIEHYIVYSEPKP